MISGPRLKFCEAYALGQNGTDAYLLAYPKSSKTAAGTGACRLLKNAKILAAIADIRAKAEEKAGSAVLTLAEKRSFVARLVRARLGNGEVDADLVQSVEVEKKKDGTGWKNVHKIRVCDKLKAIEIDNDLAGEGSEAGANDALGELLARVRQ